MMNKSKKNGFVPIRMERYIELYIKSNPDVRREDIVSGLNSALRDHQNGIMCTCGNPIWVIGSAVAGNACFTCITGQSCPDDDYEINQAMK
jgi:hypothetical protein